MRGIEQLKLMLITCKDLFFVKELRDTLGCFRDTWRNVI